MKKDIQWLIEESGDAQLGKFSYEAPYLRFTLELYDGITCEVKILSKNVMINADPANTESSYRTCRIVVEKLEDHLSIENGFYIPEFSFPKLMETRRMNTHLAIGLKAQDFPYLLSLSGYGRLISCVVQDLNAIEIETRDQEDIMNPNV